MGELTWKLEESFKAFLERCREPEYFDLIKDGIYSKEDYTESDNLTKEISYEIY